MPAASVTLSLRMRSRNPDRAELAMLAEIVADPGGLDTFIDPRDEMLAASWLEPHRRRFEYFQLGDDLRETAEQIADWAFPGERDGLRVLEFACGYGRNLRHLVRRFPAAGLFASDIDADAVAFVANRFGVTGKLSASRPEDLHWDERFDLIVVPSLFSHLPDATFARWLAFLVGLLTDRGVLAFSVHDAELSGNAPDGSGIVFHEQSAIAGRLDTREYGSTYVTEGYVGTQIETATGARRYGRVRRGFWEHQDVYLLTGPAQRDPASFRYRRSILGNVDELGVVDGTVRIRGWASTSAPGLLLRVRAGDAVMHERVDFGPRPDVAHARGDEFLDSGYLLTLQLPPGTSGRSLLVVEARAGDLRRAFFATPLSELVPKRWRRLPGLGRLRR